MKLTFHYVGFSWKGAISVTDSMTESARSLYDSLRKPEMGADGVALCLEAARMKQRLDQLDAILAGESEIFSTCLLYTSPSPRDD